MASPSLLSGAWHDLVVLTWRVDPARLAPYVPAATSLDTWEGRALISVVGVTFRHLRVLGVPMPGLQTILQVNVRIYVQRQVGGEVRHGVRFLLQLASSRIVTAGARLLLHEPYRACNMRRDELGLPSGRRSLTYRWRDDPSEHLHVVLGPHRRREAGPGSFETHVLQRCWGYTPQPDGTTLEYAVRHPSWWVQEVEAGGLAARWDAAELPADIQALLTPPPDSAMFAEGSPIRVQRPARLGTRLVP